MLEPLLKESSDKTTSRPEMEQVENEKQEYKLIGHFLRRSGLALFGYSSKENKLYKVDITTGDLLKIVPDGNGGLTVIDPEMQKCTVNSAHIFFEALNLRTAKERLRKFKHGKIKELCNLREPGEGIKFW
jgi:hypothetical protein